MISFVVPCFNEAGNVQKIYEAIHAVFDAKSLPTEIVMVNDGSKDGTSEKLKALYAEKKDPNLTVVEFSRNFGKEAALLAGLKRTHGDYVCFIDADLQQNPKVALEMYEKLLSDDTLDAVGAFQVNRKESALLKFCKKGFYSLINRLCETHFEPATSDFRMITRKMADAVLSMTEYYRFSKGIFSFVGFKQAYIPYEVEERASGQSSWSFTKLFRYAVEGIVGYTTKPLIWPLYLGIIGTVLSVILGIVLLVLGLNDFFIPEYMASITAIWFFMSILFIVLGVFGIYISKIYMQTKNRPIYIEKEVLSEDNHGNP